MDPHTRKRKIKRSGKVIRLFTVEIIDASTMPELYANSNNDYAQWPEEERLKEFNEFFGLLLAESCRDAAQGDAKNKND
jgi:hypothetical protein